MSKAEPETCCACLRVDYDPAEISDGGLMRERWRCLECGREFVVRSFLDALKAENEKLKADRRCEPERTTGGDDDAIFEHFNDKYPDEMADVLAGIAKDRQGHIEEDACVLTKENIRKSIKKMSTKGESVSASDNTGRER